MFDTITSFITAFLQEMQGFLGQTNIWLFFILFLLFIIVAYKVVKLLLRALIVAVIAGLFPVFANMFLGMSIPVTLSNVLWFAMTGVEIFFMYSIIVGFGKLVDFFSRPFKRGKAKKVEKVIIVEKSKDKHENKKRRGEG